MTKSLEKWIAEIQYQALEDNYLVLPGDWASEIKRDALEELVPGEGEYSCGNCGTGLVFEFDSRAYIGKVID